MGTDARCRINADHVVVGEGCEIGERVVFTGSRGRRARSVILGDYVRIEDDCRIYCDDLKIGDYFTLNNHCLIGGIEPIRIGHSVWVGQNSILNGTDRLVIGNAVGIGAYSQLWTHIRHGDTVQGSRWDRAGPLTIGDDVWFVGHVIVSPVTCESRAMALVGSVVTKDMKENRIYGGVPAADLSERLGPAFAPISDSEKLRRGEELLARFHADNRDVSAGAIKMVPFAADIGRADCTWIAVCDRLYTKRHNEAEVRFMRYAYPAKFFPIE